MRINRFVALASGLSRRAADHAITDGRVWLNGEKASPGTDVTPDDTITLDGVLLHAPEQATTILLNKPVGYVCSRDGQGSKTVYDLLPPELRSLKPVGRLDKDSSGLLLLTDDGHLAHRLTHPSFEKEKVYEVALDKPLASADERHITQAGVPLEDGPSKFDLEPLDASRHRWRVRMHEGRNRQIRRTFAALGYDVTALHRTHFGDYALGDTSPGTFRKLA